MTGIQSYAIASFLISACLMLSSCSVQDQILQAKPSDRRKTAGRQPIPYQPQVDVLFVVDDSGSMRDHQNRLSHNVDLLVDGLRRNQSIDYHIGVISTSEMVSEAFYSGPGAGRLAGAVKYVTRGTPDGFEILKKNLLLGVDGSSIEKMFAPVYLALTEPNLHDWNSGFYRPSAFLALIFITDAEEQSQRDEEGRPKLLSDPTNFSPESFMQFLISLKRGQSNKVLTYGAYIPMGVPNSVCRADSPSMAHQRIDDFFRISKGITYSLCDANFGDKLAGIGSDLASRVGGRMILEARPKLHTIEVSFGGQSIPADVDAGWSYSPIDNSINFGPKLEWSSQPEGTQVEIYFEAIE